MDTVRMAGGRRKLHKLRCQRCMVEWKKNGADASKKPRELSSEAVASGNCPDCGNKFRNDFGF